MLSYYYYRIISKTRRRLSIRKRTEMNDTDIAAKQGKNNIMIATETKKLTRRIIVSA